MTSWLRGSRKEKGGADSLGHKEKRIIHSTNKGLTSLPDDILYIIVSNLTYLDRFRLKLVGNQQILTFISGLKRPSFETYVAQLETATCASKMWKIRTGPAQALHIACEEGYDAMVIKLLGNVQGLNLLPGCLSAAVHGRQKSVVKLLLGYIPKEPTSSFTPKKIRIRRRSPDPSASVLEDPLGYAAATGWEWAVVQFLEHGAQASSPNGLRGLQVAASCGYEDIVGVFAKYIRGKERHKLLPDDLSTAVPRGHKATVEFLLSGEGGKMPRDALVPGLKHLVDNSCPDSLAKAS